MTDVHVLSKLFDRGLINWQTGSPILKVGCTTLPKIQIFTVFFKCFRGSLLLKFEKMFLFLPSEWFNL